MNFLSLLLFMSFLLLLAATLNSSDRSKRIVRSRWNIGHSWATALMSSPVPMEVVSSRQPTGTVSPKTLESLGKELVRTAGGE